MSDKAEFKRSCDEAVEFPKNLVYHNTFDHNLQRYSERLDEHELRLFFDEKKANLDIWDFDDESQGKSSELNRAPQGLRTNMT